jgi:hypothetical protein
VTGAGAVASRGAGIEGVGGVAGGTVVTGPLFSSMAQDLTPSV